MKKLESGFTIMELPEPTDKMGVLKHLERVGRVCYKSEDKITDTSCVRFIENLKKRKHWAMLEHYIFTFSVSEVLFNDIFNNACMTVDWSMDNSDLNDKMRYIRGTIWKNSPKPDYRYIISASATALNYLLGTHYASVFYLSGIVTLCMFMKRMYPELINDPYDLDEYSYYQNDIRIISRKELHTLPENVYKIHDFRSIKFIVPRAVSHELVRHRPCSWAQESSRYCNYSLGKFDDQISVVCPDFSTADERFEWETSMYQSEYHYNNLINLGAAPQEARSVLPQSLKTEVVMTARLPDIYHMLDMRASKAADPQMQKVAYPLLVAMIDEEPEIFSDLVYRLEEK